MKFYGLSEYGTNISKMNIGIKHIHHPQSHYPHKSHHKSYKASGKPSQIITETKPEDGIFEIRLNWKDIFPYMSSSAKLWFNVCIRKLSFGSIQQVYLFYQRKSASSASYVDVGVQAWCEQQASNVLGLYEQKFMQTLDCFIQYEYWQIHGKVSIDMLTVNLKGIISIKSHVLM